jgi:hypothetical protein
LHCIAASDARTATASNTNLIFMDVMCYYVGTPRTVARYAAAPTMGA